MTRIDDAELVTLLDDLESDRFERKESTSDPNKIRQAICAFANDLPDHRKPGVLFVGVRDNGDLTGLPITDQLLLTLSQMKDDGNILPIPSMTVEKRSLKGGEVAVIVVQPSDSTPIRFKGRVWIRVGPRRATASPEEELRLSEKRRGKDQPFDARPNSAATLDDLDLDLFRREYLPSAVNPDVLKENRRTEVEQLASLRFASTSTPPEPTNLGILVLGKEPSSLLGGAYIQFLRIEGEDITDPIKNERKISGPLSESMRLLDEILALHISIATDFTSTSREIRQPDYPVSALQQIARNAVLHRTYEGTNDPVRVTWYTERIEIQSPGGPYGRVNKENFGRPGITDYRNPHLAEAMRNLGYVQKFGAGIQIAQREMDGNGNPPIEFEVGESVILAVFRRGQ